MFGNTKTDGGVAAVVGWGKKGGKTEKGRWRAMERGEIRWDLRIRTIDKTTDKKGLIVSHE